MNRTKTTFEEMFSKPKGGIDRSFKLIMILIITPLLFLIQIVFGLGSFVYLGMIWPGAIIVPLLFFLIVLTGHTREFHDTEEQEHEYWVKGLKIYGAVCLGMTMFPYLLLRIILSSIKC
jgi:fatty acid desaturase